MRMTRVLIVAPLVVTALASGLGTGCGPNVPELPTTRIDSAFTFEKNAFPFANFGGVDRDSRIQEDLLIRLHGKEAVCADDEANCSVRPVAKLYMKAINDAMKGGRCEGFALLSGLLHAGDVDPNAFGAPTASEMTLEENEPLGAELAYWFATQYLRDVVQDTTAPLSGEATVRFLAGKFFKIDPIMYRLGIARVDEEGRLTGGHAVVPVAVGPGDSAGKYKIYVYDNNDPSGERAVDVDVNTGEWRYQASINPDADPVFYVGNPQNGNSLYLAEMKPRLGRHRCSFCQDEGGEAALQQVFGSAGIEIVSTDENGRQTGERDGKVMSDIPGSTAVPVLSAEEWDDDTGVQSFLPVSGPVTLSVRSSGTAEADGEQNVALFNQRTTVALSDFQIANGEEATLTVDTEQQSVSYQSAPSGGGGKLSIGSSGESEETVVTIGLPEDGSATVDISYDPESGNPTLTIDSDDEDAVFDVSITQVGSDGESNFTGQVSVPEGGSTELLLDEWEESGDLGAEVDTDGDGTPDTTVVSPNAGPDPLPPAAPTNLALVANGASGATLTWVDRATTEASYELERDSGAGFALLQTLPVSTTTYADSGLAVAQQYRYRVRATNLYGPSDFSNTVTYVTPGCDLGSELSGGVCVVCTPGRYCPGGVSPAVVCPPGTTDHDDDATTQCQACPAGTTDHDASSATACVACTPGEYCQGGAFPALTCAAGTWDADADPTTACVACAEGEHCPGGVTAPAQCAPGTVDDDNSPATTCVTCVAGDYCPGGAADREICAVTSVDNDSDPTSPCLPCSCGFGVCDDTPGSDGLCLSCDPGYFDPACTQECPGSGTCSANGTCDDGPVGQGSCACDPGFGGPDCSLSVVGTSCLDALLAGNTTDGLYVVDPDDVGPMEPVTVYCDMTTAGGGWTLLAYADGAALGSEMIFQTTGWDPSLRTGAEHLDAQPFMRKGGELAFSWTAPTGGNPTGNIASYSDAVSYPLIAGAEDLTVPPDTGSYSCLDESGPWRPIDTTCLQGACDLPPAMYAPGRAQDACSGNAYGFVETADSPCDWLIDAQPYVAVYMSFVPNDSCSGVVTPPGGIANRMFPDTMAIWHRAPRPVATEWIYAWGDANDDTPTGGGRDLDVVVDPYGYVYAVGTANTDLSVEGAPFALGAAGGVVIGLDPTGNWMWSADIAPDQPLGEAVPSAIAYNDYWGGVVVGGSGFGAGASAGGLSIGGMNSTCSSLLAQLSLFDGSLSWGLTLEPTNPANCNVITDVAVDDSGNVWATGSFSGSLTAGSDTITSAGDVDGFLLQVDGLAGTPMGLHQVTSGSAAEFPTGLTVLADQRIAVVGAVGGIGSIQIGSPLGTQQTAAVGGLSDSFFLTFDPLAADLVGGGIIATANEEALLTVERSHASGDFFIGGEYDGSTTLGGITVAGGSWGMLLARVTQAGDVLWAEGTTSGSLPVGVRSMSVGGADQIRFAHNAPAGSAFGGYPLATSGPHVFTVDGDIGIATYVSDHTTTTPMTFSAFASRGATRGIVIGSHAGAGTFDGAAVGGFGSVDQFALGVRFAGPSFVVVYNPGFELPDLGAEGSGVSGDIAGWSLEGGVAGVHHPSLADNVFPVDGDQMLFVNGGAFLTGFTGGQFENFHRYTLTGVAYSRAGLAPLTNLVVGLGDVTIPVPSAPAQGFGTPFEVVVDVLPISFLSGSPITISFQELSGGGIQTLIDGLRVTVEPLP